MNLSRSANTNSYSNHNDGNSVQNFDVILSDDIKHFKSSNPDIIKILSSSDSVESVREKLYNFLYDKEKELFYLNNGLPSLEKSIVMECVNVLKNIISPANESKMRFSALEHLIQLAKNNGKVKEIEVSKGFILEFIHLFKGIAGESNIYSQSGYSKEVTPEFLTLEGREAAINRSEMLDSEANIIENYLNKYPTGLMPEVIKDREDNKRRILKYFNGTEEEWQDYKWHLRHVIKKVDTLKNLIEISEENEEAIKIATENKIPFGITPYYLSLMDYELGTGRDHSVRAQVIPPLQYVKILAKHRGNRSQVFDFMGEHDTSPIDLVTRRYPQIAIFKPYNSCSQICVYCQRNWEIDQVLDPVAMASHKDIENALIWFKEHTAIRDVLITGGDPLVMSNQRIKYILYRLSEMSHIKRIRIGTRIPVVLPFRFNEELIDILSSHHKPGEREIAIVTHFQHVWEITPDVVETINKVRRRGISFYNQAVYTFENSRKFEMVALRLLLKNIGVDPYYTFNMKGKEETRDYRVPIARLLQERKEEARLIPGLDRTDEPVFNIPKLGKNHLRAAQDHQVIMILPDGRRAYEFLPWERNIMLVPSYIYKDVSISRYLEALQEEGKGIQAYSRTIWYYY